jgi:hypothetical protein
VLARLVAIIASHPHLLIEQAESYANLLQAEALEYRQQLKRSLIAISICLLTVVGGLLMVAIAVMLWAVHQNQMWVLLAVPAAFFTVALLAYLRLSGAPKMQSFTNLRAQASADARALKQAIQS